MNVFEIIEAQRPDVAPLDEATRQTLRQRFVGDRTVEEVEGVEMAASDERDGPRGDRRFLLSVAATVLVGAMLAAVIMLTTDPERVTPGTPVDTAPTDGDEPPSAYDPITVPVVEELPDPLTVDVGTDAITATSEPAPPGADGPGFTPLVLSDPPDGFELVSARYQTGPRGLGIARYRHPDHTTQLEIINRDRSDGEQVLIDLGRTTWEVEGHTVYADGEGDGSCLSDYCAIAIQWDEHTFMSLAWVEPYGGDLVAGSTRDVLRDLVPFLIADPTVWTPADPDPSIPTEATTSEAPLLVPWSTSHPAVEHASALVHGPPDSQSAVLRAPDGSMQILWVQPASPGPNTAGREDTRRVGEHDVWADDTAQRAIYGSTSQCWSLMIADGGAGSGTGAWRTTMLDLLANISTAGPSIRLPDGWAKIGDAPSTTVYELTFWLPAGDRVVDASFMQSPSAPGAAIAGHLTVPQLEPITFLGEAAWLGTDPADPELVRVVWQHAGMGYSIEAHGVGWGDLEAELASWIAAPTSEWADRYGTDEPSGNETQLPEGCPAPSLAIQ